MTRALIALAVFFTAGSAFTEDPPRVLHVLVTHPDGEPAAGIEVRCMPQHHEGVRTEPPTDFERAITNDTGIASFFMMAEGTHIVHAWDGELGAAIQHFQSQEAEQFAELALAPTQLISGTIMDPHGNPLEGVRILAYRGIPLGETDEDGRYELRTLGWLGMRDAWLYKPGYASQSFTFAFNFGRYDIILPPGEDIPAETEHDAGSPGEPPVTAALTPPADLESFYEGLAGSVVRRADRPAWTPGRITITDASGTPLPDIGLWVPDGPSANVSSADGTIVFWHQWDGPVRWHVTRAYGILRLFVHEFNNHPQYEEEVPVISQEMNAETPADLLNLRVVVEKPAFHFVRGRVMDDAGNLLTTNIQLIPDGRQHSQQTLRTRDGWFMSRQELPVEPFVLELTHPDFRPRVLASGIHFEPGGEDIEIVLERGPFPPRTSVWTAVTGQPATQEAIDAFPAGDTVRARERQYRQHVARATEETEETPAVERPEPPFPVRVVDAAGEPVREIFVQPFLPGRTEFTVYDEVRPDPGEPYDTLRNEDGLYDIPGETMKLWAEGLGWSPFVRGHERGATERRTLILYPMARVTVTVRDFEGNPVADALVGPPQTMQHIARNAHRRFGGLERFGVQTTGEDGRVDLGEWPIDFDYFSAVRGDDRGQIASAHADLRPGGTSALEIVLPPWPEGSAPALLDAWQSDRRWRVLAEQHTGGPSVNGSPADTAAELRRDLIGPLSESERAAVSRELVRRIESAPGMLAHSDMGYYASVALVLDVREAARPLRDWLRRADSRRHGRLSQRSTMAVNGLQPVLAALIALDGAAVEWFVALATDTGADPAVRAAGVVALGMMGTDASVAAWRGLRESMQGKPGMPARGPGDTHADRIAEAIALALVVTPGLGAESNGPGGAFQVSSVQVDENYEYASATMGTIFSGATRITLRRFGEDWLVTAIGATVIA